MSRLLNIFFGLKLRYVLISFILLTVILIAAGYFSIKAGQNATLAGLEQQGRALTTVLVSSASNIIASERRFTDIAIDKIIAEVDLVIKNGSYKTNQEFMELLNAELGLERISIYDRHKTEIVNIKDESRSITSAFDSLGEYFLENIKFDEPFDIIFDLYQVQERRYLFGMLPFKDDLFIYMVYPWVVGQRSQTVAGISVKSAFAGSRHRVYHASKPRGYCFCIQAGFTD